MAYHEAFHAALHRYRWEGFANSKFIITIDRRRLAHVRDSAWAEVATCAAGVVTFHGSTPVDVSESSDLSFLPREMATSSKSVASFIMARMSQSSRQVPPSMPARSSL